MENYYVYEYIRLDTNEIFYVGKGKGSRCFHISSRSEHFNNILNKVPCAVTIIKDNLTEAQAFALEEKRIHELVFEEGYSIDIEGARSVEKGQHLVNATWGGEGTSGYTRDEKSKLSTSNVVRQEWKDKIKFNYYIIEEPEIPNDITLINWYDELMKKGDINTLFKALYPYLTSLAKCIEDMDDIIERFFEILPKYNEKEGHFRDYLYSKMHGRISNIKRFKNNETRLSIKIIYLREPDSICKASFDTIDLINDIKDILKNSEFKEYQKEIYFKNIFEDYKLKDLAEIYGYSQSYITRLISRINEYVKDALKDSGYNY